MVWDHSLVFQGVQGTLGLCHTWDAALPQDQGVQGYRVFVYGQDVVKTSCLSLWYGWHQATTDSTSDSTIKPVPFSGYLSDNWTVVERQKIQNQRYSQL